MSNARYPVLATLYLESYRQDKYSCLSQDDEIRKLLQAPEEGLYLICDMLEICENEEEIDYIAAGPLEDYINIHGILIEQRLTACVRKSKKMRQAIIGVWASEGSTSQKILNKIRKMYNL